MAGEEVALEGAQAEGVVTLSEHDAGIETLRRMASVDRYNRWIYRRVEAHVGRRVLEVGCGIGNMTPFFLGRDQLVSLDLLPASTDHVRGLYGAQPNVRILQGDICDGAVVAQLRPYRFDTVVCLNVLEHIRDDALAVRNMADLLVPGGKLILFVPAGPLLYGHLDRALLHFRRYTLASLSSAIEAGGLTTEIVRHMNLAGVPGWFLSSRVLKRRVPPRGLLWGFNQLAPIFIWLEERVHVPYGLSILSISRREHRSTDLPDRR